MNLRRTSCLLVATLVLAAFVPTIVSAATTTFSDPTGEPDGQTQGLTDVPANLDVASVWVETRVSEVVFHIEVADLSATSNGVSENYLLSWTDANAGSACPTNRVELRAVALETQSPSYFLDCADDETVAGVEEASGAPVQGEMGVGPSGNEIQFTLPRVLSSPQSLTLTSLPEGHLIQDPVVQTWSGTGLVYPTVAGWADVAEGPTLTV